MSEQIVVWNSMEALALKQGDEMGAGSGPRPEDAADEAEFRRESCCTHSLRGAQSRAPADHCSWEGDQGTQRPQQCLWVDFYFK